MNSFQLSCFHKKILSYTSQLDSLDDFSQMVQTSSIFQICFDHTVELLLVVYSDDSYEQVDRLFQYKVDMKLHLLYCMNKQDVMESPHSVKNKEIQLINIVSDWCNNNSLYFAGKNQNFIFDYCSWNIFCQKHVVKILDSLDMSEVGINIEDNIKCHTSKGVTQK